MAFAGNCGIEVHLDSQQVSKSGSHQAPEKTFRLSDFQTSTLANLFSEELGLVIEYLPKNEKKILAALRSRKYLAG